MPIDITDNSIRIRQRDPGDFEKGSFRTITLDKSRGIKAVIGRLKGKDSTTTQSVLFPKDKFTVAQARKWLKDHDMRTEELQTQGDQTYAARTVTEAVWTTAYV